MTDFGKIQALVFEEYKKNGYLEMWNKPIIKGSVRIFDIAELGLIHTEISEAIETIRELREKELGEELADTIIRILNFASRKGIDIEAEILQKHKRNLKREYLHGKTV